MLLPLLLCEIYFCVTNWEYYKIISHLNNVQFGWFFFLLWIDRNERVKRVDRNLSHSRRNVLWVEIYWVCVYIPVDCMQSYMNLWSTTLYVLCCAVLGCATQTYNSFPIFTHFMNNSNSKKVKNNLKQFHFYGLKCPIYIPVLCAYLLKYLKQSTAFAVFEVNDRI